MDWHIGCSGFYYKEWKDEFYPKGLPQKKWFEYYCSRFNTLELNVTFYRFPQLSSLQSWYTRSPDNFCFSIKVPGLITHRKRFQDCASLMTDFYSVAREGLANKLGPILFQLPPGFSYSPERLQLLLQYIDPSFENVVEFRHVSWWRPDVMTALAERYATFCGISYPGLPEDVIFNTPLLYYRFHGIARLYYSAYDEQTLQGVADTILQHPVTQKVFVYFNNTADKAAIGNALFFENYLAMRGADKIPAL